jgi:hypothetical protein
MYFDGAEQEHPQGFGIDVCITETIEGLRSFPPLAPWLFHRCFNKKNQGGIGIADLIGGRDI